MVREVEDDFIERRANDRHIAVGYWGYSFGVTKAGNVDRNVKIQRGYGCR